MSIIDTQRNHVGIQSLNTQFANYAAAGQGAMLAHTDGYVYCVFARNYLNGVSNQRRLYMTRSNDVGLTWATEIEISTGNWDDDLAIIQLDTTNVNSDIGVVFSRGDALTRFTFNKETGAATSPYDQITNAVISKKWPSIIWTGSAFQIYCLARDSIANPNVYQYSNASFTTNPWVETQQTIFPTNGQPMSLSVKRLVNGDLAMIGAYRTALNGQAQAENLTTRPGMSNLPQGMLRCDVGVCFSDNNGASWIVNNQALPSPGSLQTLTSYVGTPSLDLVGIMSAASADLQQLSDTTIAVAYQEHTAPQYIDNGTTPFSLPSSISGITGIRYHASKNALIYGIQHATLGGVFVLNLTAQTSVRIQTPVLWTNNVADLDISPDGTKMAVALSDGGINIFDITDANPANWTIITNGSLRTTGSLVTHTQTANNFISKIRWDGNSALAFSYGSGGSNNTFNAGDGKVWGGYYTIGVSLVNLESTDENPINIDFVIQSTKIVAFTHPVNSSYSFLESVNKSTGVSSHPYNTTFTNGAALFYDNTHNEYIALGTSLLARIVDTGSAFVAASGVSIFNAASDPGWDGFNGSREAVIEISGQGLFAFNNTHQHQWYSYASQKPAGYRVWDYRLGLGENVNHAQLFGGGGLKSNTWLALGGYQCLVLQSLTNVGRIRWGIFSYDNVNRQLVTSGVNFYDVCNINKVGTNMTTLQFPKFCADNNNNLFWYFDRWSVTNSGGNEFAPVLGVSAIDAVFFTAKCRILKHTTQTFTAKSRIRVTTTRNLVAYARIAFARCIKIKARIVPVQANTINMKARILNLKSTACTCSFLVQSTRSTRVRLTFWTATGYTSSSFGLSCRAYIVKAYTARMTGHFLVKSTASSSNINFSVTPNQQWTMTVRARITK